MSDERWDYRVLRDVYDSFMGRAAYHIGDGIMAQVVEDLGLVVGVDVTPARSNVIDMPAGNASRADWVQYAQFQAVDSGGEPTNEELDGMTRDEIRDLYIEP